MSLAMACARKLLTHQLLLRTQPPSPPPLPPPPPIPPRSPILPSAIPSPRHSAFRGWLVTLRLACPLATPVRRESSAMRSIAAARLLRWLALSAHSPRAIRDCGNARACVSSCLSPNALSCPRVPREAHAARARAQRATFLASMRHAARLAPPPGYGCCGRGRS